MGLRSPDEMLHFSLLAPSTASTLTPRVGRLAIPGRNPLCTPHFLPSTSRGTVPHIAHDVMRDSTAIGSLYIALEDFLTQQQKSTPIYRVPTAPHESALRKFICLPDDLALVLGPRRIPPIVCPPDNTSNSIAISTSSGFRQLEADQYVEAVQKLQPDIVIGLADLLYGKQPGVKRRGKMADRTHAFTMHATDQLYGHSLPEEHRSKAAYFAPILPLENAQQSIYLEDLEAELQPHLSGLALYESASLSVIPETLGPLPRLLLNEPATPHDILRDVSLGADILTVPFINATSDAGISLDFTFQPPSPTPTSQEETSEPLPLGVDLWSPAYTTDVSPLSASCPCYTCQNHHRAYIHHLLSAKEMLAWTLLQIHNHNTVDSFFASIRDAITRGTFDSAAESFQRTYAHQLPEKTGQGPRLRGHHLPASGPSQPRRNPRAFGRLDDALAKFSDSNSSLATPDTGSEGLEEKWFARKE